MATASYLQEFVHGSAELPGEVAQKFALIKQLDMKAVQYQEQVAASGQNTIVALANCMQACQASTPAELQERQPAAYEKAREDYERVNKAMEAMMGLADEKIGVATQLYDIVDERIKHLDALLNRIASDVSSTRTRLGVAAPAAEPAGRKSDGRGRGGRKRKADKLAAEAGVSSMVPVGMSTDAGVDGMGEAEPLYCTCQRPSFGEMIGCDGADCAIEWFHYECVGLDPKQEVVGKWYCPDCSKKMGK